MISGCFQALNYVTNNKQTNKRCDKQLCDKQLKSKNTGLLSDCYAKATENANKPIFSFKLHNEMANAKVIEYNITIQYWHCMVYFNLAQTSFYQCQFPSIHWANTRSSSHIRKVFQKMFINSNQYQLLKNWYLITCLFFIKHLFGCMLELSFQDQSSVWTLSQRILTLFKSFHENVMQHSSGSIIGR